MALKSPNKAVAAAFHARMSQIDVAISAGFEFPSSTRWSCGVNLAGGGAAHLGWMAKSQEVQMLALDVGQGQRACEAIEHVRRRRAAAALLEPSVPGRAHVRALRDLLAAQARRAASLWRKPELGRIEPRTSIFEVRPQRVVVVAAHLPIRPYTSIVPRLFFVGCVRTMRV